MFPLENQQGQNPWAVSAQVAKTSLILSHTASKAKVWQNGRDDEFSNALFNKIEIPAKALIAPDTPQEINPIQIR